MATNTELSKLLLSKLLNISNKLNVKKDIKNEFGGFKYRSLESIYEKLKPLLKEYGCYILFEDNIKEINNRFYYFTECRFYSIDIGTEIYLSSYGYARETQSRPKMDEAQITGSCSSYAKKYAICNLFLIDDGEDEIDKLNNNHINNNNNNNQNDTLNLNHIINTYKNNKNKEELKNNLSEYSKQLKDEKNINTLKTLYIKLVSNKDYQNELNQLLNN